MDKNSVDKRPDWDTYFMAIANVVALRGNCSRRKVAAVIVADCRIISTGYNGTPRGIRNCFEGGCPRCSGNVKSGASLEECVCVHAEQCLTCAKMIINAGIREVVYAGQYAFDEQTKRLFDEAGVLCRHYEPSAEMPGA